jgi:hypothetical protein
LPSPGIAAVDLNLSFIYFHIIVDLMGFGRVVGVCPFEPDLTHLDAV